MNERAKKISLLARRKTLKNILLSPFALLIPGFSAAFSAFYSPLGETRNISTFLENRDKTLRRLFETTEANDDASIIIDMPIEAEHLSYVPFRITATGAEKLAVFIEPAENPLVACFTLYPPCGPTANGTVDLQEGSVISCYVLRNKQLFRSSRYVRTGISGYDN
ncbi:MAG: hypothetical protein GKR95_09050 [Gammaproteobacteria bacterium]|nr:hypothetical protein [Gammaproteobacteria bacterium]